ncbi:MAG: immunoglobulin domain-containing protein, partial [Rhodoferax sp.]|nr:immunoglobulin domain-containing protein [Rhodoferax sp.]
MKHFHFKSIAAVAASSIVLALAACGGGGGDTGGGAVTPVEKPAITSQPANQTVETGKTATFTVQASGGGTLSYQWKKNGVDIPSATASTYSTPATSNTDDGTRFSVAVTNSAGTATSSEATLTVTAVVVVGIKPAITTHPAAQTVVTGTPASFSVSASGTAPLIYQWQKEGTDIPGATSSTYTIAATNIADSGGFAV